MCDNNSYSIDTLDWCIAYNVVYILYVRVCTRVCVHIFNV